MFKIRDNGYMSNLIQEYDKEGREIYKEFKDWKMKTWYYYNPKGMFQYSIKEKKSERWYEYDKDYKLVDYIGYLKYSNGVNNWYKMSPYGQKDITEYEYDFRKRNFERKEAFSRKRVSRWEIMDI